MGVDVQDDPASGRAFLRQHQPRYPSLNDPGDRIAAEFNQLIAVAELPSTLVVTPGGRIAGRVTGAASSRDLRRLITAAQ